MFGAISTVLAIDNNYTTSSRRAIGMSGGDVSGKRSNSSHCRPTTHFIDFISEHHKLVRRFRSENAEKLQLGRLLRFPPQPLEFDALGFPMATRGVPSHSRRRRISWNCFISLSSSDRRPSFR